MQSVLARLAENGITTYTVQGSFPLLLISLAFSKFIISFVFLVFIVIFFYSSGLFQASFSLLHSQVIQ